MPQETTLGRPKPSKSTCFLLWSPLPRASLGFLERGLTAWQAMQAEAAVLRDARPRLAMRGGARKHRLADQ